MIATVSTPSTKLVVCVKNQGYEASLELRKLYCIVPDPEAKKHKLLRVVDESGEDYLYPEHHFLPAALPPAVRQAVLAVA